MPHHEDRFEGHDGLSLYQQWWLPETEPAAVVVLIHGFTEHSSRYARVAHELNRQGYAVYALDLRGHGKSGGQRVWVRSFDEYLADLDLWLESVRRREPEKPLFLFGYSMGGTLVALFALTRQPDVRGLLLSVPALKVGKGIFPILRRLAALVSRLFPRLRIVTLGSRWVSRDPQVVDEFRSDPLVFHGRFPVRTGAEILGAGQRVLDGAAAIRLPLLILQGTGDRVVDPQGSRQLCARASSDDKTLRLYKGLYHDLLHEPEKEHVVADVVEWLNGRR